jgi:hypothetical protein
MHAMFDPKDYNDPHQNNVKAKGASIFVKFRFRSLNCKVRFPYPQFQI